MSFSQLGAFIIYAMEKHTQQILDDATNTTQRLKPRTITLLLQLTQTKSYEDAYNFVTRIPIAVQRAIENLFLYAYDNKLHDTFGISRDQLTVYGTDPTIYDILLINFDNGISEVAQSVLSTYVQGHYEVKQVGGGTSSQNITNNTTNKKICTIC